MSVAEVTGEADAGLSRRDLAAVEQRLLHSLALA